MSVLLLSEIFPPQNGGSGRWFWEIYHRLPREEYQVAAGTPPGAEAFDRTHNLRVTRLGLKLPEWGVRSRAGLRDYLRLSRELRGLIRGSGVRTIHAARCLPEGWLAWMLHWWTGVGYIVYVHGEDIESAALSREHRWMVRGVFRRARLLVANSYNTARLLREQWGLGDDKVQVLHPGVDTQRFRPAARNDDVRRALGWGDRPVVLTVGRLQKRKGHDQLILALREIRRQVPDVLYAIVGDGEERKAHDELVAREGLRDHVQFLAEIGDERLVQCYQQCDVFVLPNRQVGRDIEGFGMVLLEAQACGKPVIAGASGGTAETMRVGETGWIMNCDGPETLSRAVAELLLDRGLRGRMGEAGREWVVDNFDWEPLAEQAESVFRSIEKSRTRAEMVAAGC